MNFMVHKLRLNRAVTKNRRMLSQRWRMKHTLENFVLQVTHLLSDYNLYSNFIFII